MEEKKFDLNSLIGFVLLGAIMIWYFYMNQPAPTEAGTEVNQNQEEQIDPSVPSDDVEITQQESNVQLTDSLAQVAAKNKLGDFAYAEMLGVDDYIRKPFAIDRLIERRAL